MYHHIRSKPLITRLVSKFVYKKILQEEETKIVKLTSREKRFIRFASVEYDGQLYMTPQDFLESVVEAEPRRKAFQPNIPI